MTKCKEIQNLLDEFYEGTLTDELKTKVQEHLDECEACNNEYRLLNNFILKARYLQTGITIPQDIEEGISDELIKRSEQEIENKKTFNKAQLNQIKRAMRQQISKADLIEEERERKSKKKIRTGIGIHINFIWFIVIIILSVSGYVYYELSRYNSPWDIKPDRGTYKINGQETDLRLLDEGDRIETGSASKLRVNIPNASRFELDQNSSVTLQKAKDGDNILRLNFGTISIFSSVFQPGLSVYSDSVAIHDPGSIFKVFLDTNSETHVEVIIGLVSIESKSQSVKIARGYKCDVLGDKGITIPYHKYASASFQNALIGLEAGRNIEQNINALVNTAKESDALTLLYLLSKVNNAQRFILFEKINEFFFLPAGATQQGIMQLNPEMLNLWWDEIEWQL